MLIPVTTQSSMDSTATFGLGMSPVRQKGSQHLKWVAFGSVCVAVFLIGIVIGRATMSMGTEEVNE